MNVLIGLVSPIVIGFADHLGANLGRRGRLMASVLAIYVATMLSTLVLTLIWGGQPTRLDLILGAGSGLGASIALLNLYRGYATRGVGIVAPVAAVTGVVIPIGVDSLLGNLPSPIVGVGMLVGVIAIWLIGSKNPSGEWDMLAVRYGLVSGVLFGFTATVLGLTSDGSGLWPLVPGRVVALGTLALLIVIRGEPAKPLAGTIPLAAIIGLAGGIGLGSFILAAQVNLAIAGLFFQMGYGFTLLFQVIFEGERTTRTQVVGFCLAVLALSMIILG